MPTFHGPRSGDLIDSAACDAPVPGPKRPDYCCVKDIQGFCELLSSANEPTPRLREGATLLLSGPPGAGKTTFALATIRAMMAHVKGEGQHTIAYYISSEVDVDRLRNNFAAFGWFGADVPGPFQNRESDKPFTFNLDSKQPDQTNFYCITQMLEIDRPVPSPEELVNDIFNRIATTLVPSEAPAEGVMIYVIIDSITALLKGCESAGEERRQTHEILRRLQDRFGRMLALTVLLAEQDHRSQDQGATVASFASAGSSIDDSLADIVFRLYVRNLPLGRRARVLEVVKSQGSNISLGEHTWQIISKHTYNALIRDERFQDSIFRKCAGIDPKTPISHEELAKTNWGGIVIFPRPRFQERIGSPQAVEEASSYTEGPPSEASTDAATIVKEAKGRPASAEKKALTDTGTKGLELEVQAGRVTLIAGPMGCGKSTLCRQFLEAGATVQERDRRMLISFELPSLPTVEKNPVFTTLHFTQSQFDLNVLIAHIQYIVEQGCDRLAFDGLSEWITTFEKSEAARVLEVLMLEVTRCRGKEQPPSVFMTYELPLDDDPLGPTAIGGTAANLIVVRKVPINDELRRVIYVLKHDSRKPEYQDERNTPTHLHPAELKWDHDGKLAMDFTSLEAFTGLLSASREVRPARALVQMFAENEVERQFNEYLEEQLENQFSERIDLTFTRFSLAEIGNTLQTAFRAGRPSEVFSLAIHSVDEWWLQGNEISEILAPLQSSTRVDQPRALNYRDFWWFEVEKALSPPDGKGRSWYAVPAHLDFGMFCINLAAMEEKTRKKFSELQSKERATSLVDRREQWRRILNAVPRLWARVVRTNDDKTWFGLDAKAADETVVEFALRVTGQEKEKNLRRKAVFTFDSSTRETCACMFMELAWAFGAKESFLADERHREAAKKAMLFLQFLVLEGLMPARCSTETRNHNDHPILFSRHWYSTLRKYAEGGEERVQRGPNVPLDDIIAIPFMPTGQADKKELLDNLLDDIEARHDRWLQRALVFYQDCPSKNNSKPPGSVRSKPRSRRLNWKARLQDALADYQKSRDWLLKMSEEALHASQVNTSSNGWSPDLDDLIELAAWSALRLQLFFGCGGGKFPYQSDRTIKRSQEGEQVADALYEAKWVRHSLPDLSKLQRQKCDARNVVATGYVCSGSWMYGVARQSRSTEIQSKILTTLTSLDNAEERAALGVGMSARKDFIYLKGEKPVVGMEYLQWREFLRYSGARARRRSRVAFPENEERKSAGGSNFPDPARLYAIIHREMLACLRFADLWRQDYARDDEGRQDAISRMMARSEQAIQAIYDTISPAASAK